MSAPEQPPPILPELPVDLSDPVAIDNWYAAWNQWIADEASKQGWSWLKPMTPAMLHEVVEKEKQRRAASGAQEAYNNDLIAARSEMVAVESSLRARDPSYEAKRRILIPVLNPLLRSVPPTKWRELWEAAYSQLQLYESQTAEAYQRDVEVARAAIRNLEHQYKAQDPDYDRKTELLKTVLMPAMRNMHASRWVYAYQQAYANIKLPQQASESRSGLTDIALVGPDGVRRSFADEGKAKEYLDSLPSQDGVLFVGGPTISFLHISGLGDLVAADGAPYNNHAEIKEKVNAEFWRARYEGLRCTLLEVFDNVRKKVEAALDPDKVESFSVEWERQYRTFIYRECWVPGETPDLGNIDFETLRYLTKREIEWGRIQPDHYLCERVREYFTPPYDLQPSDMERVKQFTASILRGDPLTKNGSSVRVDSPSAPDPKPANNVYMTVLLYRLPEYPEEIGISKVDPPVAGGAFLLDFNKPLLIQREFLGLRNRWIGRAIELEVPVVHEADTKATDWKILVYYTDPRFQDIRSYWERYYPRKKFVPPRSKGGLEIVADFGAQFPQNC